MDAEKIRDYKTREKFFGYCRRHPEERFLQAVLNFIHIYLEDTTTHIYAWTEHDRNFVDTFHWECDEMLKSRLSRYKLLKELPTFNIGDEFFLDPNGGLWLDEKINGEPNTSRVMAYNSKTLEKFPNILRDWFEPVEESDEA